MTDKIIDLAILPATSEPWQLLLEDEQFVVVQKPAGLLTVPGRHPMNRDCLLSRVQQEFPSASVVHRLDYDTSGLVVLPLTKKALSAISIQFQARTIKKRYQAVVAGTVQPIRGEIDAPIKADEANRPLYKIDPLGKPCLTCYDCVRQFEVQGQAVSLMDLEPITGRSHQLRLHMKHLGHAILGDPFYASDKEQALARRLMLHAYFLQFTHPVTGALVSVQAEPDFFSSLSV